MARKDDELLITGRKKRPRTGQSRGTPRIIWAAIIVCVVGAALLFRNPGSDVPTGIGENRTVVTIPSDEEIEEISQLGENTGAAGPHSGEVDIGQQGPQLTPEQPDDGSANAAATQEISRPDPGHAQRRDPSRNEQTTEAAVMQDQTPAPVQDLPVARPTPRPESPPRDPVVPLRQGQYLVQVASFGDPANADREANRLQDLGWDARVIVTDNADGSVICRVKIGYFATREDAEVFIAQNKSTITGAIPVHR